MSEQERRRMLEAFDRLAPQIPPRPLVQVEHELEAIRVPWLVPYEWLRSPRSREELAAQQALFPAELALPFGPEEARLAARLYRAVARPRGREVDLAIAAFPIARDAALWTLNVRDFRDLPLRVCRA